MSDVTRRAAAEKIAGAGVPVSIEPDGTAWTGTDDDRTYLDVAALDVEEERMDEERATKRLAALDKLLSLGLTVDDLHALGL
jgi:hypothetical protein